MAYRLAVGADAGMGMAAMTPEDVPLFTPDHIPITMPSRADWCEEAAVLTGEAQELFTTGTRHHELLDLLTRMVVALEQARVLLGGREP